MLYTKTKIEDDFQGTAKSKTFNNLKSIFGLDKKSVFDIGCSNGEFLVHFGPGSVGVTIAKEEVEYGKFKGLDVRYGNIESDKINVDGTFDVIFANNIFEHMLSPHNFLCRAKRYLKPEGVLILGVPCIPKVVSLLHIRKFKGSLAVAHINFFTRDTFIKTVERGGWKIATIRTFHFHNEFLDRLLDFISPHFYIIATPDLNFRYHTKRMKELSGYSSSACPVEVVSAEKAVLIAMEVDLVKRAIII